VSLQVSKRFITHQRLDRRDQIAIRVTLTDIAVNASLTHFLHQNTAVVNGKNQYLGLWQVSEDLAASKPFLLGILKSKIATSGLNSFAFSIACWPSLASATIFQLGFSSMIVRTPLRTTSWSSAMRRRTSGICSPLGRASFAPCLLDAQQPPVEGSRASADLEPNATQTFEQRGQSLIASNRDWKRFELVSSRLLRAITGTHDSSAIKIERRKGLQYIIQLAAGEIDLNILVAAHDPAVLEVTDAGFIQHDAAKR